MYILNTKIFLLVMLLGGGLVSCKEKEQSMKYMEYMPGFMFPCRNVMENKSKAGCLARFWNRVRTG